MGTPCKSGHVWSANVSNVGTLFTSKRCQPLTKPSETFSTTGRVNVECGVPDGNNHGPANWSVAVINATRAGTTTLDACGPPDESDVEANT